jgi:hypothetical protein
MLLKINAKFGFKSEIDVAPYQLITNTELGLFLFWCNSPTRA